eukprot:2119892-Amphidinium_carterae.1
MEEHKHRSSRRENAPKRELLSHTNQQQCKELGPAELRPMTNYIAIESDRAHASTRQNKGAGPSPVCVPTSEVSTNVVSKNLVDTTYVK